MSRLPDKIILGGETWSAKELRKMDLKEAIQTFRGIYDRDRVTNAWKQAKGLTVPTTERTDTDRRSKKEKLKPEEPEEEIPTEEND